MKPEDVRKIGVVGSGIMGSGIVEVCAKAGFDVVVVELNEEAMARGRSRFESSMAKAVERGKIEPEARDEALGRSREDRTSQAWTLERWLRHWLSTRVIWPTTRLSQTHYIERFFIPTSATSGWRS